MIDSLVEVLHRRKVHVLDGAKAGFDFSVQYRDTVPVKDTTTTATRTHSQKQNMMNLLASRLLRALISRLVRSSPTIEHVSRF